MNPTNGTTHPTSFIAPLFESRDENEIARYWQVIVGHRWTVLAITAVVSLLSVVYFSILPNWYTATVQILVEKVDKNPKSYQEVVMPSLAGDEDYYGTQIAILTGRRIANLVRDELKCPPDYRINARRLRGTRIILLSAKHRNPEWASAIANKFSEVYVRESMKENLYIPQQLLRWLPSKGDMLKEDTQKPTGAGDLTDKKDFAESLDSVANDPVVQKLRDEKMTLDSQLREMLQRYKPQHPLVKETRERANRIEQEINLRTVKIVNNLRANMRGDYQLSNIRVLEEALTPGAPSEPHRLAGILVATLLGFGAGIFWVLFADQMDQKIRDEEDITRSIQSSFFGYLPFVKQLLHFQSGVSKAGQNGAAEKRLAMNFLKDSSELADAIASLRTRITFAMKEEHSRELMITSTIPNEGKSTLAFLLAMSYASLDQKVLIIDLDLRKPSLHSYLPVRRTKSLMDFLRGSVSLEEIIETVAVDSHAPLSVVTGGRAVSNPIDWLESERMSEFFEKVHGLFDRIIVDAPPASFMPDGLILTKYVPNVVLVCGSGMAHRRVVQSTVEKFAAVGRPFLGVVINKADFEYGSYSYQYSHYKSYRHYYQQEVGQPH